MTRTKQNKLEEGDKYWMVVLIGRIERNKYMSESRRNPRILIVKLTPAVEEGRGMKGPQ